MTDDTESLPILTVAGPRATLRLNRPAKLNRLQQDDLDALMQHFDAIEADRRIRVLVLTGTGRAFSAGFDLKAIAARAGSHDAAERDVVGFAQVADRLENLTLPTVCRLNGGVYGGSTDLALACDFRIGIDTAEMFMPAARFGLHYYPGGIARYVSRLGADNAKKLFLTAQKIDAAEMLRIGYLTQMAGAEGLDAAVDALVDMLTANAPQAMRGMKQAINEFARGAFDRDAAERRNRDSMRGDEIKEGVAALAEQRKPTFADR